MPVSQSLPGDLTGLQPDLLRAARKMTGSTDQAQDLSQDVLLKVWTKQCSGSEIQNLRAYAMTTMRNTFRQYLRQIAPGTELKEDMMIAAPNAFATLALRELDAAITRLPGEQAQLIRMVAAGETSPTVLSDLTGLPVGTVMSRLARARMQLRTDMGLARSAPVAELI